MLRIAVCDDTSSDLAQICRLLELYQGSRPDLDIKVRSFSSAAALLEEAEKSGAYDIYLLDVLMPGHNGIEVGKRIRAADRDSLIIYLSLSRDFALESYSVYAFQYLVKPAEQGRLFQVLDDAVERLGRRLSQIIPVKTREGLVSVQYHSIAYVEYVSHVLYFHLSDRSVKQSLHIRTSFENAAAPLLRDPRFLHPHKSYIVNMYHIQRMTPTAFVMGEGTVIPIVRKNYRQVKNQYLSFLSEQAVWDDRSPEQPGDL